MGMLLLSTPREATDRGDVIQSSKTWISDAGGTVVLRNLDGEGACGVARAAAILLTASSVASEDKGGEVMSSHSSGTGKCCGGGSSIGTRNTWRGSSFLKISNGLIKAASFSSWICSSDLTDSSKLGRDVHGFVPSPCDVSCSILLRALATLLRAVGMRFGSTLVLVPAEVDRGGGTFLDS